VRKEGEFTDLEKRLFWECLKLETRYAIDVSLPESGLASLDLITDLYDCSVIKIEYSFPLPEKHDIDLAKWHTSRFDLWIAQHGLQSLGIFYSQIRL
jgi:hypothetical protein